MRQFTARVKRWLDKYEPWFKKHETLLSYASLLIILLTFAAREGFNEHWQGIADTIDMAQYVYSIRIDTSTERVRFGDVTAKLAKLEHLINKSGSIPARNDREIISGIDASNDRLVSSARAALENVKLLTEKIDDHTLNNRVKEFDGNLQNASGELAAIRKVDPNSRLKPIDTEIKQWQWHTETRADWSYKSSKHPGYSFAIYFTGGSMVNDPRASLFSESMTALQGDLNDFNEDVLKKADELKRRNETLSAWAWAISIGLFLIGFFLGLIGKVYKLKVGGGQE